MPIKRKKKPARFSIIFNRAFTTITCTLVNRVKDKNSDHVVKEKFLRC